MEIINGITWEERPIVRVYTLNTKWYVLGIQRIEKPSTIGWSSVHDELYLQMDGGWRKVAYYFETESAANTTLNKALGAVPVKVSAIALAIEKARARK